MSTRSFNGLDTGGALLGLAVQGGASLLTIDHLWRAALLLPALLIGVSVGARGFRRTEEAAFRRGVYVILALMAVAIGVQGVAALLPP